MTIAALQHIADLRHARNCAMQAARYWRREEPSARLQDFWTHLARLRNRELVHAKRDLSFQREAIKAMGYTYCLDVDKTLHAYPDGVAFPAD